jgi:glutathione peroxidase
MASVYDFSAKALSGEEIPLSTYRGTALLIVNVASACGFTPQYAGLQRLHDEFSARGFAVLGFPCNQFGHQEPGDAEEIRAFCTLEYGVAFPLFAKIDVNGEAAHPLYKYLKAAKTGLLRSEAVKWNFTKFLVDRAGNVVERYAPTKPPDALKTDVEAALAPPAGP